MVRYNQESNIYDTIYENRDITVEYDFTSSELDHFVGTGTFDGVTINRIFEIHENNGKDASGFEPIFIKPLEDEKKKKKSIN